jgi:Zn-dependent peptidase ImmA (M78 family)
MNSNLEVMLERLEMMWAPGAEAVKVQQAMDVRSLADVTAAVQRAGYEVCCVDLPERVSGFAQVIEGKPHIVLNRAKSAEHLQYTLAHELGHHVLHLDDARNPQPGLPSADPTEFQAHQFATLWILYLANDKEREDVLSQNPEWLMIGFISLLMTAGVIVIPLIAHLLSSLNALLSPAAQK